MDELFKEAYKLFADLIASGMYIMPPDPNFLFVERYEFSDLSKHRDVQTRLIGQLEPPKADGTPHISGYPCANNLEFTIDFGDSVHKAGILAFCNSAIDQQRLPDYEISPGFLVRHPTQPPWNNPKNCTRDQLLAYSAGCWRMGRYDSVKRLLDEAEKRTYLGFPTAQNSEDNCPGTVKPPGNTDILDPTHVMFLRICSGDFGAYLDPLAQFILQVAIEVTDKDVKLEKNQLILQAIVCGRLDLYVKVHDNYKENIRYYWANKIVDGSSRRDQEQIGEAFITVIDRELKRYSGQLTPSTLGLPIDTLKSLFKLNLEELFGGNFAELENYVSRIFTSLASDVQKVAKEVETYVTNAIKNPLAILNVPFTPFNPVAQLINNIFKQTDLSEVYYRLNEIQKGILELKSLSQKIIDDVHAIPQKTLDKLYTDAINFSLDNFKDYSEAYHIHLQAKGLQSAQDEFKNNFISIGETINENTFKFFSVDDNKKYPFIPFVVNCMQLHVSCVTLSGQSPALIIAIIKKYQSWLNSVLNDFSSTALRNKILELQKLQKDNKNYIKHLYSLHFTLSSQQFTRVVDAPELPPLLKIQGKVRKQIYELVETISVEKVDSLTALQNVSKVDFPEIVKVRVIGEDAFDLSGVAYPLEYAPSATMSITFAEGETSISVKSTEIWDLCSKKINSESPPFSPLWSQFKPVSEDILTCGESIINHSFLMLSAKNALQNIDEIVSHCNDLLIN